MTKLYFIQHNHSSKKSTEDFFKTFGDMFTGIDIEFSNKLIPNEKNLILDEFTKFSFVKEVLNTKFKHPNTKIYLIFTEYITFNNTFNYFNKSYLFLLFRNFFYNFIYIAAKKIDEIEKAAGLGGNRKFFLKDFFLIFIKFYENIKKFIRVCYNYFLGDSLYMHFRFIGYSRISNLIDVHLVWNDEQKIQLERFFKKKIRIINFLPEIKKIKNVNEVGISLSGIKTSYRVNLCKKMLKKITVKNNLQSFINAKGFHYKNEFYSYSLNPGKNKNWNFPSLIRYAFSIQKNEMPIVIDKFQDRFTRNVSLYFSLEKIMNNEIFNSETINDNIKKLNNGIEKYNEIYQKSKNEFEKLVNEKH